MRTPLDPHSPLRYRARQGGFLYAALWTWDYGFLEHLPAALRSHYNGWTTTDAVATVARAPAPFDRLPVYRRYIPQGDGSINLDAYVGQWIILGFDTSPLPESRAGDQIDVVVSGARSRHNVVELGQSLRLDSPNEVMSFALCHDGAIVQSGSEAAFAAPLDPGRYALVVRKLGGTATLPLTVALRPAVVAGWEKGFFPVHFYNGYSYAGLFFPNRARRGELQTLAMFEMGANTLFVSRPDELAALLHMRRLLNVKSATIPLVRRTEDEDVARRGFEDVLATLSPLSADTLGLYVEDEPPLEAAGRLARFAGAARGAFPGVPLFYTLVGKHAPAFWGAAESDVRMLRAYPIRKKRRGDLRTSIEVELVKSLEAARETAGPARVWLVVQAFGDGGRPNLWDQPSSAQLRLMVNLALARGVRALTYFCYDSSPRGAENLIGLARWPFVPQSELYGEVRELNEGIGRLAGFLASTRWERDVPQEDRRFDVQALRSEGGTEYAWITNWDTERPATGTVSLGPAAGPIGVALEPGGRLIIDLRTRASIEGDRDLR